MKPAYRKRPEIDAELDRLEVEFKKNRKEMQRLAALNKCTSDRYSDLLNANHDINDRIRALLEERWKLEQ